jgi:hypothetical protein
MKYLFFSAALLMGMDPQSTHAQFGGRATHGSQGGSRNFQVSMPQLRILIREVVTEVVRDSNRNFSENSVRTTEKTIDQLTTGVERRLALRAPIRIVRESAESGGLRGHEGRDSDRPRGVERKPWEREGFIKSNHEGNRRQLAENLRKQTERTGETALLHRPPVQTTLYYRPGGGRPGSGGVTRPVDPPVRPVDPPVLVVDPVPPTLPPNNGGGQVGIGGGPGPVPPSFPGGPIGVGMPAPEPRPAVEAPQPPTSEGGGGDGGEGGEGGGGEGETPPEYPSEYPGS